MVDFTEEEYSLKHIGIIRRSGRYPWGSGKDPYQRSQSFRALFEDLKSQGYTMTQIAEHIQGVVRQTDPYAKFNTADLRYVISRSTEVIRTEMQAQAVRLKNAPGREMGASAIAKQLGVNESTVRGWLKASQKIKEDSVQATADKLKEELKTKPFLDVGKGNELYMGITFTKLNTALAALKDEGYNVHTGIRIPQQGTSAGKLTTLRVLTSGKVTWAEARLAVLAGKLQNIFSRSDDGGLTFRTPKEALESASSKQIEVRYAEDGGTRMDGVIELRRGIPSLDLGSNRYGQVRIAVDGTHYMKGMAMYADDLPPGVNMRFNSAKSKSTPGGKVGVMKPMKTDADGNIDLSNPFGASTYPHVYVDKNGKEHNSLLNIVGTKGSGNIEGRWDQWARSLSSQMLSKQPVTLASAQLNKARVQKQKDLDEILAMTNPVVKKKLLEEFADSADAAAGHLKAAKLPDQSTHVLLPMNSMRPTEIYAPNFKNGDRVVLVRHPHGGPFEIPELTVNNKNLTAKRLLGNATDAVGIHHSVAEKLSGADFDGDTVLVIPNPAGKIKSRDSLQQLKGFDPKAEYAIAEGDTTTQRMTKKNTQTEMGRISNLITDMSLHRAPDDEIARAVRHSMVVIDAEKHGLNYKQSELDHNIQQLRKDYQGRAGGGASTLLSRANADVKVPQLKQPYGKAGIDPATGKKILLPTGKSYQKDGKTIIPKSTFKRIDLTDDARSLLSDNPSPMERLYADHSNYMKALANAARKEGINVKMPETSIPSKRIYEDEVASLTAKLKVAERNAPREREAQSIAGALIKQRIDANPQLDDDSIKKLRYQSLEEARNITGAAKERVYVSDSEWVAIQARAVPHTKLATILRNADMDRIKTLATPKYRGSLTPGQLARAKQLQAQGKPMSDIADQLGIPRSTIIDNINNS